MIKAWDGNNNLMLTVTDLRFKENGELYYIRGVTEDGQSLGCHKTSAPERFKKIALLLDYSFLLEGEE